MRNFKYLCKNIFFALCFSLLINTSVQGKSNVHKLFYFAVHFAFSAEDKPLDLNERHTNLGGNLGIKLTENQTIFYSYDVYRIWNEDKNSNLYWHKSEAHSLNYKYRFANLISNNFIFRDLSASLGIGQIFSSDENYLSINSSLEKNIRILGPLSIPLGIKLIWAPNPPTDQKKYKTYWGVFIGLQMN